MGFLRTIVFFFGNCSGFLWLFLDFFEYDFWNSSLFWGMIEIGLRVIEALLFHPSRARLARWDKLRDKPTDIIALANTNNMMFKSHQFWPSNCYRCHMFRQMWKCWKFARLYSYLRCTHAVHGDAGHSGGTCRRWNWHWDAFAYY